MSDPPPCKLIKMEDTVFGVAEVKVLERSIPTHGHTVVPTDVGHVAWEHAVITSDEWIMDG